MLDFWQYILISQCQSQDIIYKCTVSTSVNPDKVYLRTAEGDFKKLYHNHMKSFCNKQYTNDKSLSKYILEIKEKHQENLSLEWSIVKRVPAYSNVTKCVFYVSTKNCKLLITHSLKDC